MALYPKITNDFLTNPLYGTPTDPQEQRAIPGISDAPSLYNPQQFTAPPAEVTEEDRPGFLRRIRSQPGGDMALLQFGAAMLSSNSFGEGLGKGALAYRTALDAEAEKGRPKLTKDNEFTYRIDPDTGEPVFAQTAVGDFTERQNIRKLTTAELIAKSNQAAQTGRTEMTLGANKERWQAELDLARDRLDAEGNWRENDRAGRENVARLLVDGRMDIANRAAMRKLPPAGIQRMIEDNEKQASSSAGTVANGNTVLESLRSGSLKLGMANNLMHTGMIKSGIGVTEAARQYGSMQQFIASLSNAILMDAKGVQTDGDAVRARLQVLAAQGDNEAVAREMALAIESVDRARDYAARRAVSLARDYGASSTAPAPTSRPTPARGGTTTGGTKWQIIK